MSENQSNACEVIDFIQFTGEAFNLERAVGNVIEKSDLATQRGCIQIRGYGDHAADKRVGENGL